MHPLKKKKEKRKSSTHINTHTYIHTRACVRTHKLLKAAQPQSQDTHLDTTRVVHNNISFQLFRLNIIDFSRKCSQIMAYCQENSMAPCKLLLKPTLKGTPS